MKTKSGILPTHGGIMRTSRGYIRMLFQEEMYPLGKKGTMQIQISNKTVPCVAYDQNWPKSLMGENILRLGKSHIPGVCVCVYARVCVCVCVCVCVYRAVYVCGQGSNDPI